MSISFQGIIPLIAHGAVINLLVIMKTDEISAMKIGHRFLVVLNLRSGRLEIIARSRAAIAVIVFYFK